MKKLKFFGHFSFARFVNIYRLFVYIYFFLLFLSGSIFAMDNRTQPDILTMKNIVVEKRNANISCAIFDKFDVDSNGVVIQNDILGSDTIIILSTDSSSGKLFGPIVVSGKPAKVIIVNSNGLICDSCRFYNTLGVELRTDVFSSQALDFGNIEWIKDLRGEITIDKGGIEVVDGSLTLSTGKIKVIGQILSPLKLQIEAHGEVKDNRRVDVIDIGSDARIDAVKVSLVSTEQGGNISIAANELFLHPEDCSLNLVTQRSLYVESRGGHIYNASSLKDTNRDFSFAGKEFTNVGQIIGKNLRLTLSGMFTNSGFIKSEKDVFAEANSFYNYRRLDVGGVFNIRASYFVHDRLEFSPEPANITANEIVGLLEGRNEKGYAVSQGSDAILEAKNGISLASSNGDIYFGYRSVMLPGEIIKYAGSRLVSTNGKIHVQSSGRVVFDGTDVIGDLLVEAKGEVLEKVANIITNKEVFSHKEGYCALWGWFGKCVGGWKYINHFKTQSYFLFTKNDVIEEQLLNSVRSTITLTPKFSGDKKIFAYIGKIDSNIKSYSEFTPYDDYLKFVEAYEDDAKYFSGLDYFFHEEL